MGLMANTIKMRSSHSIEAFPFETSQRSDEIVLHRRALFRTYSNSEGQRDPSPALPCKAPTSVSMFSTHNDCSNCSVSTEIDASDLEWMLNVAGAPFGQGCCDRLSPRRWVEFREQGWDGRICLAELGSSGSDFDVSHRLVLLAHTRLESAIPDAGLGPPLLVSLSSSMQEPFGMIFRSLVPRDTEQHTSPPSKR